MTTANKITVLRIMMIPFFVMMALYYGRSVDAGQPEEWMRWLAIVIFVTAAATDGIDGYIARRYNQKTRLGAVLDPVADKGLLLAGIVTLSLSSWTYRFPLWFVVLIVSRDLVILAGTLLLHHFGGPVKIQPSWMGKTATVMQMIALSMVMVLQNRNWLLANIAELKFTVLDLAIVVAAFFTLASGVGYAVETVRHAHFHGEEGPGT